MSGLQTEHVPEWRDEMADSRYPFEDDSKLVSADGAVTIPNDFLLDASVCASFDEVGLYSVTVPVDRSDPLVVTFAPPAADRFASATLAAGAALADLYENESAVGVLVLADDWSYTAAGWAPGTHRFDHRKNRLVPAVVRTGPTVGVEGLVVDGETVSGEVWLVADDGLVLSPDGDGRVRLDVIGDPLFRRRKCEPDDAFVTPLFARTINGQPPDAFGGFTVTALPGSPLRVYTSGDELRVEMAIGEGTS